MREKLKNFFVLLFNILELKSANAVATVLIVICVIILFTVGNYLKAGKVQSTDVSAIERQYVTSPANPICISVNINYANTKELVTLPGIGNVLANRIVLYRTQNGAFKNKESIMNVKGISKGKFEKIKNLIEL